jgi:hypothetical protein
LAEFEGDAANVLSFSHGDKLQLLRCKPSGKLAAALCLHRIYYDRDLVYHSPDPSDPTITRRVMVVMLASEY